MYRPAGGLLLASIGASVRLGEIVSPVFSGAKEVVALKLLLLCVLTDCDVCDGVLVVKMFPDPRGVVLLVLFPLLAKIAMSSSGAMSRGWKLLPSTRWFWVAKQAASGSVPKTNSFSQT